MRFQRGWINFRGSFRGRWGVGNPLTRKLSSKLERCDLGHRTAMLGGASKSSFDTRVFALVVKNPMPREFVSRKASYDNSPELQITCRSDARTGRQLGS